MLKLALVDELHNLKTSGVYHANEDVKKALQAQGAKVTIFAIKKRGPYFNKLVTFPYLRDILILPMWNRYIFRKIDQLGYDVAMIRTTNNLYLTRKSHTKKVIYTGALQTRQLEILMRINVSLATKFIALMLYPIVSISEYLSLRKADAVLVSKQSFVTFIKRRFRVSTPKVRLLPGITVFESASKDKDTKKKFDVLFIGRLSVPKNWPMVLKIARDTDLQIAAVTPENNDTPRNLPSNITIFSRVPRHKMANLYESSRVFLMPSFMEGGPKCTLEAMAMGLPVVASQDGAGDFVVHNENGQVITVNEADHYIAGIRNYLENPVLYKKTRKKNIERAKLFGEAGLGEKYFNILAEITENSYNNRNDGEA